MSGSLPKAEISRGLSELRSCQILEGNLLLNDLALKPKTVFSNLIQVSKKSACELWKVFLLKTLTFVWKKSHFSFEQTSG